MLPSKSLFAKVVFFSLRKFQTFFFILRHPTLFRGEFRNTQNIQVGTRVSIGHLSRIFPVAGPHSQVKIEDNVWIGRGVELQPGTTDTISLGPWVSLQDNCKILGSVKIGAYTTVAPNVLISSGTHQFKKEPHLPVKVQDHLYPARQRPVTIGEDCWIGVNVFINRGVTVGRGAIIGANAVILQDVKPYAIMAGNPAKEVGQRLTFQPRATLNASNPGDQAYFLTGFEHDKNFCGKLLGHACEIALPSNKDAKKLSLEITIDSKVDAQVKLAASHLVFPNDTLSISMGQNTYKVECAAVADFDSNWGSVFMDFNTKKSTQILEIKLT